VSGGISVVHNGIIENHERDAREAALAGYEFTSETDLGVIAHLVHSHTQDGFGLLESVRRSIQQLQGASPSPSSPTRTRTRIVCARMGAPLLVGLARTRTSPPPTLPPCSRSPSR
jgi:glucosamine--fructose-6-phosphate aminotransferase (isomerizing)